MVTIATSLNGVVTATTTALASFMNVNSTKLTAIASAPLSRSTSHAVTGKSPAMILFETSADSNSTAPNAAIRHCSGEESSIGTPIPDSCSGCTKYCIRTRRTTSSPSAEAVRTKPAGERRTRRL